jgi:hypothetical protein
MVTRICGNCGEVDTCTLVGGVLMCTPCEEETAREDASDRKIANLDYAREQEHEGFYRD